MTEDKIYFGLFDNEENYCKEYGIPDLAGYNMIFAIYHQSGYAGSSYELMSLENELYVNESSHCSCYELDGQFSPVKTSYECIKNENWDEYDPQFEYKELIIQRAKRFEDEPRKSTHERNSL